MEVLWLLAFQTDLLVCAFLSYSTEWLKRAAIFENQGKPTIQKTHHSVKRFSSTQKSSHLLTQTTLIQPCSGCSVILAPKAWHFMA